jgi:hypothetical protein
VKPSFLITIDTEGDNLWARKPWPVTTRNARFLPRFQFLCERFGFKPTYLVNHEMAHDPFMVKFGRDIIQRGAGEIGAHLHAWDSPPIRPLTSDDNLFHPYLIEYPDEVAREKLAVLTDLLSNTFKVRMASHRAGRWALNAAYARMLVQLGYRVDCSVTPYVSWVLNVGDPNRSGGSDYTRFPNTAYFPNPDCLSRVGSLPLLEVPVTIMPKWGASLRRRLPHAVHALAVTQYWLDRLWPVVWLRPSGSNLRDMMWLLETALSRGQDYVEFMLHSSELMPGGSRTFADESSIEKLYEDLVRLFSVASETYSGATMIEYYSRFQTNRTAHTVGTGSLQ